VRYHSATRRAMLLRLQSDDSSAADDANAWNIYA